MTRFEDTLQNLNPQTPEELEENRLAAIKAGAVKFHQVGPFKPITHWAELTNKEEK